MSFLLKIVQGPHAGAEIALAEGVTLSIGSADDCDIVLSDATIAAHAMELEITHERVMAILPEGQSVKLDPFHVKQIGTTALVVGPDEGAWKELVWPTAESTKASAEADEEGASPEAEVTAPEQPKKKRHVWRWLLFFFFLIAGAGALGYSYWKYPEPTKAYAQKTWALSKVYAQKTWTWTKETSSKCYSKVFKTTEVAPPPPQETLEEVVEDCNLQLTETQGQIRVRGDFATRVERLTATARVYAAHPGANLDFSDTESLTTAAEEFIFLLTEGAMTVQKVEGRKVFFAGRVKTHDILKNILTALHADVPKVEGIDCSQVVVDGLDPIAPSDAPPGAPQYQLPRMPEKEKGLQPEMPIVGILIHPYPCLVLADGSRAMEGARFGETTIEKIHPDAVTLRNAEKTFLWRP